MIIRQKNKSDSYHLRCKKALLKIAYTISFLFGFTYNTHAPTQENQYTVIQKLFFMNDIPEAANLRLENITPTFATHYISNAIYDTLSSEHSDIERAIYLICQFFDTLIPDIIDDISKKPEILNSNRYTSTKAIDIMPKHSNIPMEKLVNILDTIASIISNSSNMLVKCLGYQDDGLIISVRIEDVHTFLNT